MCVDRRYPHLASFARTCTHRSVRTARILTLLGGLILLSACGQAQDSVSQATKLLHESEQHMQQQAYEAAAESARAAAKIAMDSPRLLQRAAEVLYRSGQAEESLPIFDRVVELTPEVAAHNWQRGLALCTCEKWEQGAEQFKTHHDVNPDDVENSAWYFLCIAKTTGLEAAKKTVIPSRGDGREPMMSILAMLKGTLEPDQVMVAAIKNTPEGERRKQAQFYADLYVGLYYDSLDNPEQAAKYLKRSLSYDSAGYMVDTARVYLADRFGNQNAEPVRPSE